MKTKMALAIIIMGIMVFSFLPIWTKPLKNGGSIKINSWQKFFMKID